MTETNKMLEECANYLLNHCFVLGGVEDQRAKYLYVQDHLNEVRAVFAPLGYSVVLYPAPLQAAALVNEHEGSQARLLKYESILLLVLRLLYLQKRESPSASETALSTTACAYEANCGRRASAKATALAARARSMVCWRRMRRCSCHRSTTLPSTPSSRRSLTGSMPTTRR